jgi:hypothetical protein
MASPIMLKHRCIYDDKYLDTVTDSVARALKCSIYDAVYVVMFCVAMLYGLEGRYHR